MNQCIVGVPKERKAEEGRVAITPDGVKALSRIGAVVAIEKDAGLSSGFTDEMYRAAGALTGQTADAIYLRSDIIVKVKEPIPEEYRHLAHTRGKIFFTYFHLAGVDRRLTLDLVANEVTAIAYETVCVPVDGHPTFPLLAPMSRIAGVQGMRGALLRHDKERYPSLRVVIVGAGVVGEAALNQALVNNVGKISVFDISRERVRALRRKYKNDPSVSFFLIGTLDRNTHLEEADIVIGAVMTPGGAEAPHVLNEKRLARMKNGAHVVDVAIDQGGSTDRSRVTKPGETYIAGANELVFSCVPNIPGSTVPNEATAELTKATLPYVIHLARNVLEHGLWSGTYYALRDDLSLRAGLQTFRGKLVNQCVSSKHGIFDPYQPLDALF